MSAHKDGRTMEGWAAAVLAAGKGTRMRSRTPKVLHTLGGRPLIAYALDAVAETGVRPAIVVRDPSPALPEALGPALAYAVQGQPDGSGGALRRAVDTLEPPVAHLLVVNGDMPLITAASLRRLAALHTEGATPLTLLTCPQGMSPGLGRVQGDGNGNVVRIVEASAADYSEAAGWPVNCGAYCFEVAWLRSALAALPCRPDGEYYLTDLVEIAHRQGTPVQSVQTDDPWEALGINTRVDLARAEQEVRRRTLERLMLAGVTVLDPATTYVDTAVHVGQDTVLHPNTFLRGRTRVGEACVIGPGSQVVDSQIGDRCRVLASVLEGAVLEEDVDVGPYSHLRPGTYLSAGVHIGNFSEVKASRLGRNVKMGHFGYVGDAEVGDDVNLGAGTVTCNFDGVEKHHTVIEEGAFIGSDTMLVAPVRIGARAATGSGAVVTEDVPPDTLVVGVPARPLRRLAAPGPAPRPASQE